VDTTLKQILDILLSKENVTSFQISSMIGLSEKTVRTRLKTIADELFNNGAKLVSKTGFGYYIVILNRSKFDLWIDQIKNRAEDIPSTSTERVDYLLTLLIEKLEYIKIDDLTDELYVSRNTITSDIKKVEEILEYYKLKIVRKPNHGLKIEGDEINRRACISNRIYKNNLGRILNVEDEEILNSISRKVYEILCKHKVKLTDYAFENLIVHIIVAFRRVKFNHQVNYNLDSQYEMTRIISHEAMILSREIIEYLQTTYDIFYCDDEILHLALHLSGKASSDSLGRTSNNLVISRSIDKLIFDMLEEIYNVLKIDLRDNLELRMSLSQHMVPLDVRLKYNISLKNPILNQVKKEYAFAYTVALTASSILSNYYEKEIPDDEIGFLTVLFALVIEVRNRPIRKYNIVVVCSSGRGTSQLFMYKYKQAFGKYINRIHELSVFDLENLNFQENNIDYIFSTIPLKMNLPVPIFEVSPLLDDREIDNYQKIFENGNENFIYHYFNADLFISVLNEKSKNEVLKTMCDLARKFETLPDDYYELVMRREEMGQTDFGNLVAIPHAYKVIGKKKFVVASILEKPIWWGNNEVQVVFLISLTGEDDEDVQQLYKLIMNYLSNIDLVKSTIKNPSFENLIYQLKEAFRR